MDSWSHSSMNLRRRYSISPNDLILPKTSSFLQPPPCTSPNTTPSSSGSPCSPLLSFPSVEFELTSLNSQSYTSLKDILPATSLINSPTLPGPSLATIPCYEIPIRNRLVKQAAWAYLQPMAASPSSCNRDFCFVNPINVFSRLFNCGLVPALTRAFHQFLVHLRIRTTGSAHW